MRFNQKQSWSGVEGCLQMDLSGFDENTQPLLTKWLSEGDKWHDITDAEYTITIHFTSTGHYEPQITWGDNACPADYLDERYVDTIEIDFCERDEGTVVNTILREIEDSKLIEEIWNSFESEIYEVELDNDE